jgi:hypothetical protein
MVVGVDAQRLDARAGIDAEDGDAAAVGRELLSRAAIADVGRSIDRAGRQRVAGLPSGYELSTKTCLSSWESACRPRAPR